MFTLQYLACVITLVCAVDVDEVDSVTDQEFQVCTESAAVVVF